MVYTIKILLKTMPSKCFHTPEEKKDFSLRVNSLTMLPKDFVARVMKADPSLTNTNRIENVRYGRTVDFHILEILEDISQEAKDKLTK